MPGLNITPFLGRHLTVASITPLTINANTGVETAGTAIPVQTYLEGFDFDMQAMDEEISAVVSGRQNMVTLEEGISMSLDIIKVAQVAGTEKLVTAVSGGSLTAHAYNILNLLSQFDYFKVIYTVAIGSNTYTVTYRGKRGSGRDGVRGKGRQNFNLSLVPADFGADTFTIA